MQTVLVTRDYTEGEPPKITGVCDHVEIVLTEGKVEALKALEERNPSKIHVVESNVDGKQGELFDN